METEGETVFRHFGDSAPKRPNLLLWVAAGSSLPISSSFYVIRLSTLWGFYTYIPILPLTASVLSSGWKWRYPKHDKPLSFLRRVQCKAWLWLSVCYSGDWLAGNVSNSRQVVVIICGIWWLASMLVKCGLSLYKRMCWKAWSPPDGMIFERL